jgi:Helix-turn-helix domain/RDD family
MEMGVPMDIRRQLNEARLEHSLTLEQIAMRTALSASVLRHLDEGRFELLPPGLYARSYVRAFATEVGLDPEATLAQLEHLLPGAPNPLPILSTKEGHASTRAPRLFAGLSGKLARLSGSVAQPSTGSPVNVGQTSDFFEPIPGAMTGPLPIDGFVGPGIALVDRRSLRRQAHAGVTADLAAWLRMSAEPLNDTLSALGTRALLTPRRTPALLRVGAAAIDALLLGALDVLLLVLIALTCAIPMHALVGEAWWAVATVCAIPVATYFLLFGGIGGSTVGRYACSLDAPHPHHPLRLPEILRRALVGR